jgi:hypothetical protein
MDEHRKMAEEVLRKPEIDASLHLTNIGFNMLKRHLETALRTTASKSEKDGYRRGVEDSAKCVRRLNNTQFGNNEHWMEAHIRRLIREEAK